MKLAALLLVHGNPLGLARLVDRISHPDITVFVHVDAKSPVEPFTKALAGFRNLVFLQGSRRMRVNWGGRSQIDAILQLMLAAMDHEIQFDWFLSLTGADYPICRPSCLLNFLTRTEAEIIRIDRTISRKTDNKIRPFSLHDVEWLNPRNYRGLRSQLNQQILRISRRIRIGSFPENLTVVHGSSSHCLSRSAVAKICEHHAQSPEFYAMLSRSFSGDELYFHTILFNAGYQFLHNHIGHPERGGNLYGMHYIDWGAEVRSPPKLLGPEDLDRIRATDGAMFVRKVDPRNTDFLDKLDEIALARE